jgi:hypothetical protein
MCPSGAHSGRRGRGLADDPRRRERLRRQGCWVVDEEAEHEAVGSGGARREQPTPAVRPERFTHLLIRAPRLPAGGGWAETDPTEPVDRREIDHVEPSHAVAPDVARQLVQGRYTALGEMPVPLRPQRLLVVGQVERVDDVAALPAVVARRLRPNVRVRTVRNVTRPRRRDQPRVPVSQASGGAGRLELGHDPRDPSRPAASDQLERLLVVKCLDRP